MTRFSRIAGCNFFLAGLLGLLGGALPARASDADAAALYRQGDYRVAEEAFRKADMEHPKDPRWRYNRGCAAYKAGDLDGSHAAFASVLKRAQDRVLLQRAAYNLGCVTFDQGDYGSAVEHFQKALTLDPSDEDARYNLQLALWRQARVEKEKPPDPNQPQEQVDEDNDPSSAGSGSPEKDRADSPKGQEDRQDNEQRQPDDSAHRCAEKPGDPAASGKGQKEDASASESRSPGAQDGRKPEDQGGELRAAGQDPQKPEQARAELQNPAFQMARKRAEALLDNVQEDPSLRFRSFRGAEQNRAPSGKQW